MRLTFFSRGSRLNELMAPDTATQGLVRGLGFDHPSGDSPSCGLRFGQVGSRGAVGHLGFTGCSLWVDLDRELSVALLTNRVYPTRKNVEGIRRFRPAFHNAVLDALDLG